MVRRSSAERLAALAVLGLTPEATPEQITHAYRRLAKGLHPDATGDTGTEAAHRFAELSDAYHMLSPEPVDASNSWTVKRTPAAPAPPGRTGAQPPGTGPPIVAGPVTIERSSDDDPRRSR